MKQKLSGRDLMNRFVKWMMCHPHLAKWLLGLPCVLVVTAGVHVAFYSLPLTVVVALLYTFVMFSYIDGCYLAAANKATKHLNDTCDYEPLLALTEEIVRYAKPSPNKQIMHMNYAVCHLYKGDFLTARQIMTNININKFPGAMYYIKMLYYNNLAEIEDHLGNNEAADVYFDNVDKLYRDLKPGKKKELFKDTFNSTLASHLYRNGDYRAALEIMDKLKPSNLCSAVQSAHLHARILIALGENERAKEALNFAIANGGKLYVVSEAKEILASIS